VPTFAEGGFTNFTAASWVGFFVPAKTPPDAIAKLHDAIDAIVGPGGEIKVFDITDEARDNYITKKRGGGGQVATWAWTYTRDIPERHFDCAVCLQGVQHTDDWRETGAEMLRVMKRGRNIVLAEIAYSPETRMKIGLDMHIEYIFDKLLSRVGWKLEEFPYYSPQDLAAAFKGLVIDPDHFVWKGIEIFWGRKP
jgi:ubiquinone/menaquinone biosynthesis C-methylase UbiE